MKAKHRILLLSSGTGGSTLYGFHFTPNSILKIPKFTIEKQDKAPLKQTDISICQMYFSIIAVVVFSFYCFSYGKLYCVHIYGAKKEIVLYQLTREVVIKRQSVDLHTSDPVYLHIVDNLIVAHSMDSKVR